ncbi:GTP-binding protein [Actinoplanes sp. TFC3]|uniref:CobW family GTP-binding protein n=1 Tax=Actinoplanes sp. TFC3 TaxID=1710355 RepID=UPI001F2EE91E|nr:GTP-binding protein [Actinoplanes sp. TFC3]
MSATEIRTRVTVLAGFSAAATEAVARALLSTDPRLILVSHDLANVHEGVVRRTVRSADTVLESGHTELVHGCISCTLREDVLPALVRWSRQRPGSDILLALPPAIEPEAVAAACAASAVDGRAVSDSIRLDSIVTVVEATGFLDELASTDDLRDRGLHAADNDDRAVADVLSRQVEFADTLVVWGSPDLDSYDNARLAALLHRLGPWAVHARIGDSPTVDCTTLAAQILRSGRHDPAVPGMPGRTLEGFPIGVHDPDGDHGVNALLFRSRRPFHPQRLYDALDELTSKALRGRGQLWIASQSDTAIAWESAGGGLALRSLGAWLAALPSSRWDEASDMRRLAADADWDLYYGDRRTVLSFVGLGPDAAATTSLLDSCLLTDAEIAAGQDAWHTLPDPFAGAFTPAGEHDTPPVTEQVAS